MEDSRRSGFSAQQKVEGMLIDLNDGVLLLMERFQAFQNAKVHIKAQLLSSLRKASG